MAAGMARTHASREQRSTVDLAQAQLAHARGALETLAKIDMSAHCRLVAAIRQPELAYPVARLRAIAAALEQAASVPLQVAEWAVHALEVARVMLPITSVSGVGDGGAGSYLLLAAGRAAIQNVGICTTSKLASQGWRGWARGIDARAKELLEILDEIEADIKSMTVHGSSIPFDSRDSS
jgi:formiminotetrahydrofolate cyclodeaminase